MKVGDSIYTTFKPSDYFQEKNIAKPEHVGKVLTDEEYEARTVNNDSTKQKILDIAEMLRQQGDIMKNYASKSSGVDRMLEGEVPNGMRPYDNLFFYDKTTISGLHSVPHKKSVLGQTPIAVYMNGIEFMVARDHNLKMASTSSSDFDALEELPKPKVPDAVLAKSTVEEQVEEMEKWFRDFKFGDLSQRNYISYFKPVLCYLEGFWLKETESVAERLEFEKQIDDLHYVFELGLSSGKNEFKMRLIHEFGIDSKNELWVTFMYWAYRLKCHPLKHHLPRSQLVLEENPTARMVARITRREEETGFYGFSRYGVTEGASGAHYHSIDDMMAEIPGLSNGDASVYDATNESLTIDPIMSDPGRYKRKYMSDKNDVSGSKMRYLFANDKNLFAAHNNQEKVIEFAYDECHVISGVKKCKKITEKTSFALPYFLYYQSPLESWNVHNITYKGDAQSDEGFTVVANGRDGGSAPDKAFDGINSEKFYMTPCAFFNDSSEPHFHALDQNGNVQKVCASGHRIATPHIKGSGRVRLLYPIMSVAGEGNPTLTKAQATTEYLLNPGRYSEPEMTRDDLDMNVMWKVIPEKATRLLLLWDNSSTYGTPHSHLVYLSAFDIGYLKHERIWRTTTSNDYHDHVLMVTNGFTSSRLQELSYKRGRIDGQQTGDPGVHHKNDLEPISNEHHDLMKEKKWTLLRTYYSKTIYKLHIHYIVLSDQDVASIRAGNKVSVTTSTAEGHSHATEVDLTTDSNGKQIFRMFKCDQIEGKCGDGHTRTLKFLFDENLQLH